MKKFVFCFLILFLITATRLFPQEVEMNCIPIQQQSPASMSIQSVQQTMAINSLGGYLLPAEGEINVLFIFAQFPDDLHDTLNAGWPKGQSPANMNTWVDSTWSNNPTEGSMTHYFNEMSFNQLHFIGKTVSVIAPHTRQWYLDNNLRRGDINREIIEQLDQTWDFAEFDNWDYEDEYTHVNQPDTIVDMIFMVWRNYVNDYPADIKDSIWTDLDLGRWGNLGGDSFTVDEEARTIRTGYWPSGNQPGGSGITIGDYFIENMFRFCIHEFAHYLEGSNDYHQGYGFWGMCSGWGVKSFVANSFERHLLGWMNLDNNTIQSSTDSITLNVTLQDFVPTGEAYRLIINENTNQYFYIENHQNNSYWENNQLYGLVEDGIYIIRQDGTVGSRLQLLPADGRFNWEVNQQTPNPWGGGSLPVYKQLAPNRVTGLHDCQFIPWRWNGINQASAAIHFSEDPYTGLPVQDVRYAGDGKDAFRIGYNEVFSPWSNPNSQRSNLTETPFGISLTDFSDEIYTFNIHINTSQDVSPSKPQLNLFHETNLPIVNWLVNGETDVTGYRIERNYNNGGWQQVGTVNSRTVTSFADLALLSGFNLSSPIKYRVRAVDSNNNLSLYSEEAALIIDNTNFKVIYGYIRDAQSNPMEGVSVNFSNNGGSAVTDANGLYVHAVALGWNGDVTPVYSCYNFSPSFQHYNYVGANQNKDYDGNTATYKISGTITFNSSNPLSGVAVKFYDTEENLVNTITTNSSGYYEATFPCGWSGEIVPVKTDVAFTSESISVSNLSANSPNNIFDGRSQVKISGWIYYQGTSNTVDNAEISFYGGGFNATDFSDHGYYEMEIPPGWSGSIYVAKTAHRFTPDVYNITNFTTSAQINFSAQILYETISGYIKDAAGSPVENVNVNFSNGGGTAVTDANGFYQRQLLQSWSGSVKPEKDNAEFYPDSITINLSTSFTNQNFAIGYVYQFNHETKITPFFSMYEDYWLGKEVAINNNHLAISGPGNGPNYWKVALYKFDHLNLTWQSTNTFSNTGSFGNATDLYEDYMLIGQKDYYDSWYHGNAHLYHFQNNNWVFVNEFKKYKYAADGTHIKYGSSVGLENEWMVIGDNEFQRSYPYNGTVGGVFIYKYISGSWQEHTTLLRNELSGISMFGTSVDINKSNLIIGAPGDVSEYIGKAFIYEYKNNTWNNSTTLDPSGICSNRNFGKAVAVTDSFAFVSSPFDGSTGSVIVYKKVNNNWVFTQMLKPTVTTNISEFGGSISCSIDYLVISGKEYSTPQKVYVFRLVNNQWVQHKQFNVTYSYDNSDIPVSIYKDKIAAGAPGSYYYYAGQNYQTGAAYVWTNNLSLSKSNIELVQGITENEIPEEYGLSQNYPNPFNPSTVIKYQIPENSFVDLKIFDVLGREISVLTNEFKGAGSYEAVFNASNLPSGIYIYKLTTSKYTEIKKMILLK